MNTINDFKLKIWDCFDSEKMVLVSLVLLVKLVKLKPKVTNHFVMPFLNIMFGPFFSFGCKQINLIGFSCLLTSYFFIAVKNAKGAYRHTSCHTISQKSKDNFKISKVLFLNGLQQPTLYGAQNGTGHKSFIVTKIFSSVQNLYFK